jgi:hypothetical protein
MGEVVQTRRPSVIVDTESSDSEEQRILARARGFRSVVFVPLIRGDAAVGTLNVTRREPGVFTDHQIGLLKTFADQAVIAIENVRLFNETKRRSSGRRRTAEIPEGHQQFADRCTAGLRRDCRVRFAVARLCGSWSAAPGGRRIPSCRDALGESRGNHAGKSTPRADRPGCQFPVAGVRGQEDAPHS